MSNISTHRSQWVDIAKGIAIILVVYGHVLRGLESASIIENNTFFRWGDKLLYSFHMPLFFILSGLFLEKSIQRYGSQITLRNKFNTILYPYIIWSLLHTLIEAFLSKYTNGQVQFSELLTCIYIPRAHFWFLFALFFINLINIGLYALYKNRWLQISFILATIFYFMPIDFSIFNASFKSLIFFNIGILVSPVVFNNKMANILASIKVLCTSLLLFGVVQYIYILVDLDYSRLMVFIVALIGSFTCITFSFYIERFQNVFSKLFISLGKASLYIYLMHILVTAGSRIVLSNLLGIRNMWLHIIMGVILGVWIPYLVVKTLRNNKLFNKLFRWNNS